MSADIRPTNSEIKINNFGLNVVRNIDNILISIIGPKIKSWLQEELNLLNNPAAYGGPPAEERYLKIRGSHTLDQQGMAILKNLSTWRDGVARKVDRPRGHILKDTLLVELAKVKPTDTEELKTACGLSDNAIAKYGKAVIAIIEATLRQSVDTYPPVERPIRLSQTDRGALENLNNLINLKAGVLGIAPGLVGNSGELKLLVTTLNTNNHEAAQQLRQTEGWRKSFLEDFFRQNWKK